MQDLYRNLALESSKQSVAQHKELQMNHEKALAGLRLNHETAVYSLNTLSKSINTLQDQVVSYPIPTFSYKLTFSRSYHPKVFRTLTE